MSFHRVRLAAVVATVVLAVCAAGCSDDDDPSGAPSTSTVTTTEVVETTVATTTSTAPPTTPPPPSTAPTTTVPMTSPPSTTPPTIAPDDWPAILTELSRRQVALYAAPDLSRIGEYCAPGTDCATRLETQLSDAIARGLHVEGQQPFDVIAIEQATVSDPSPAARVANIIFVIAPETPPPARLVDAAGNVVDEFELNTTESRGSFTLASWESDPSLPWRVVQAETLSTGP